MHSGAEVRATRIAACRAVRVPARSIGAAFVALAALVVFAGAVAGHSDVLEVEPADGARLDPAPRYARLWLSEPVDGARSDLRVINATGARMDAGDVVATTAPASISVTFPRDLPEGGYIVGWELFTQSDGHLVLGASTFVVGNGTAVELDASRGAATTDIAGRALFWSGVAVVLGAVVMPAPRASHAAVLWACQRRIALAVGWSIAGTGAAVRILAGAPSDGLRAFARSTGGEAVVLTAMICFGCTVLFAVWSKRPVRLASPIALAAAGTIAWLLAQAGHAGDAPTVAAMAALHGALAAAWVGLLLALAIVLSRPGSLGLSRDELSTYARHFGTVATAVVTALVVTGGVLTTMLLGPDTLTGAWIGTPWGRALGVKVVGLLVMLGLAVANRRRLHDPRRAAAPGARWLVAAELVAGAVVVVVAAGLARTALP